MTYEKMSEFCIGSPYKFHMALDEVERLLQRVQKLEKQLGDLEKPKTFHVSSLLGIPPQEWMERLEKVEARAHNHPTGIVGVSTPWCGNDIITTNFHSFKEPTIWIEKAEKPKTCGTCKHPWRKPDHSLTCWKKNQGTGTKPSVVWRAEHSPACGKYEEKP